MARKPRQKEPSPSPSEEELVAEPADSINPYEILSLDKDATQDQIKTAYRKAALKHHPDKAAPETKEDANTKFQEIATAYAILSDEKRRRRYDTTGNTSESLDDDDFDWTDFFREQSAAVVNGDMIEQIKKEYQGSVEEQDDVLKAYEDGQGDMDMIYETVMCSDVLADDQRFRGYIDEAIKSNKVEKYMKYTNDTAEKRKKRIKKAKQEEQEAMALADELGIKDKLFRRGGSGKKDTKKTDSNEDALKALIQQRQQSRSENFLDNLEAKYGGGGRKSKGKRKVADEPPEELFQKNAKKSKG